MQLSKETRSIAPTTDLEKYNTRKSANSLCVFENDKPSGFLV